MNRVGAEPDRKVWVLPDSLRLKNDHFGFAGVDFESVTRKPILGCRKYAFNACFENMDIFGVARVEKLGVIGIHNDFCVEHMLGEVIGE